MLKMLGSFSGRQKANFFMVTAEISINICSSLLAILHEFQIIFLILVSMLDKHSTQGHFIKLTLAVKKHNNDFLYLLFSQNWDYASIYSFKQFNVLAMMRCSPLTLSD